MRDAVMPVPQNADVCIVGGGAAGFFCALSIAERCPSARIILLEQGKDVLSKVRISGGGRCNVTHACFDVRQLVTFYPRGGRELMGPFTRFGPRDTIRWFEERGVPLKTESDGRMFPRSDSSDSIIQCFLRRCTSSGIRILTRTKVSRIDTGRHGESPFVVATADGDIHSRYLMLATGSSPSFWALLSHLGYTIVPPVPSLFTFNLPGHALSTLMGITLPHAVISLPDARITTEGPLLITHWGISGPAVLRASAEAARWLEQHQYHATILIRWSADTSGETLRAMRQSHGKNKVSSHGPAALPQRLWKFLCDTALTDKDKNWASLSRQEMDTLVMLTTAYPCTMKGKITFKEEFVTAGGVSLAEIDFRSFQSKRHPGLYMAGEMLDIDAVTGGFNFQAAWTGGYLAGQHIAQQLSDKKETLPA